MRTGRQAEARTDLNRVGHPVERLVGEGRGAQEAQRGGDVGLEGRAADPGLALQGALQVGEDGDAQHLVMIEGVGWWIGFGR